MILVFDCPPYYYCLSSVKFKRKDRIKKSFSASSSKYTVYSVTNFYIKQLLSAFLAVIIRKKKEKNYYSLPLRCTYETIQIRKCKPTPFIFNVFGLSVFGAQSGIRFRAKRKIPFYCINFTQSTWNLKFFFFFCSSIKCGSHSINNNKSNIVYPPIKCILNVI